MPKGIHVRYLGDDVVAVEGVGVFQKGTVAFAPRETALGLLSGPLFEAAAGGPTAQAFIVRIGQELPTTREVTPLSSAAPEAPADFELALEDEERRLAAGDDEPGPA